MSRTRRRDACECKHQDCSSQDLKPSPVPVVNLLTVRIARIAELPIGIVHQSSNYRAEVGYSSLGAMQSICQSGKQTINQWIDQTAYLTKWPSHYQSEYIIIVSQNKSNLWALSSLPHRRWTSPLTAVIWLKDHHVLASSCSYSRLILFPR